MRRSIASFYENNQAPRDTNVNNLEFKHVNLYMYNIHIQQMQTIYNLMCFALYYQPKQCIFIRDIPQNYHRFLLFDSPNMGIPPGKKMASHSRLMYWFIMAPYKSPPFGSGSPSTFTTVEFNDPWTISNQLLQPGHTNFSSQSIEIFDELTRQLHRKLLAMSELTNFRFAWLLVFIHCKPGTGKIDENCGVRISFQFNIGYDGTSDLDIKIIKYWFNREGTTESIQYQQLFFINHLLQGSMNWYTTTTIGLPSCRDLEAIQHLLDLRILEGSNTGFSRGCKKHLKIPGPKYRLSFLILRLRETN